MTALEAPRGHWCKECVKYRREIGVALGDIRKSVRLINARPGTPLAKAAESLIAKAKEDLRLAEDRYAVHLEEIQDEPDRPRKIRDVRKPKSKAKKPRPKSRVIDLAAVAAAKADLDRAAQEGTVPRLVGLGTNTLPATGRCHECDRPVSGERRFCGRCMAKRKT